MKIPSYPTVFALGHRAIEDLLKDPVVVQEKIDGSQFSFGLINGVICYRSKGAEIFVSDEGKASAKMFQAAIDAVRQRAGKLVNGWVYYAEYVPKPKAVTLTYGRVPKGSLVLFDACLNESHFADPSQLAEIAYELDLECATVLHHAPVVDLLAMQEHLDRESMLGAVKIEGMVFKNYIRFGLDKKILAGKMVREDFREVAETEWKKANPKAGDIVEGLILALRTEARWEKAVQHLRESGRLLDEPKDIGTLFQEVPKDIERECADMIRQKLYEWAWPKISRGATAGLAEWYKRKLADRQLAGVPLPAGSR